MQGTIATMELRDIRAMLRLSQGQLAKEAGLSTTTVNTCERGDPILRTTAYAMLEVLNKYRQQRGMEPLSIQDINWKVKG